MNLSLILNILNFVLGGFVTTLGWLFATVMSAALIITLPYTRSCWEICKMSLLPFGNDLIHVKYLEPKSAVKNSIGSLLNIIWFVFFGWWLFIFHILYTYIFLSNKISRCQIFTSNETSCFNIPSC